MKKVFAQRLLKVVKSLRESPNPKEFTMDHYGNGCGTPACALGHYANRTDLQKTFRLRLDKDFIDKHASQLEYSMATDVVNKTGKRQHYAGLEILKHFGIDWGEAEEIFGGNGCGEAKTPSQAARYIEKFVVRKLKEDSK